MADAILAQGTIYAIRNIKTLKMYVGQTTDTKRRWTTHRSLLRTNKHHSIILQHSFNKYGEESFKFVILEECAVDAMTTREQFWIDHFDKTKRLYNVSKTARPLRRGNVTSDEVRSKISAAHKGRKLPASQVARLVTSHMGKTHSEETKQKMRESQSARSAVARQKSIEQMARPGMRELLASRKRGGKASIATKQKLSEVSIARWMNPVQRDLMLSTQLQGKLAKSAST